MFFLCLMLTFFQNGHIQTFLSGTISEFRQLNLFKSSLLKKCLMAIINVSNVLFQSHTWRFVDPECSDLAPNCSQRLTADDKGHH